MFEGIFKSDTPKRDKFLSRFFGIFSEEFVRCWCNDARSPYKDLGRPTLRKSSNERGHTLDFTFESRTDGNLYVVEMKCLLEFENYKFLRLDSPSLLEHLQKNKDQEAFRVFLDIAKNTNRYQVKVGGKELSIQNAILVWGSCNEQGRSSVVTKYGLHDVISLEDSLRDLAKWNNREFLELLNQKELWCQELFNNLRNPR